jgi:hypothetical protein
MAASGTVLLCTTQILYPDPASYIWHPDSDLEFIKLQKLFLADCVTSGYSKGGWIMQPVATNGI